MAWAMTKTRGREGGAKTGNATTSQHNKRTRGRCNKRTTRDDGLARRDNERGHNETTRQREGDATTSQRNERMRRWRGVQQEDEERRCNCDNKLEQRVEKRVAQ
jgi:hypothetical protein